MSGEEPENYGYSENFGLFEKPVVETGAVDTRYIPYHPTNQILDEGPIEFYVSGFNMKA